MARRGWRSHLLILLIYTLLVVVLTWPLAIHLGSHVPGNGVDDPPLTWNLWWVKEALLRLGTNPFACDYLFYPLGINLAFYTLTVLNGLLSIPLQALGGLVVASNLLLLSSFVLGGYGMFLLSGYLLTATASRPVGLPAFVAGLVYAFASCKLSYAALGQWNITSSQWIPFYILYLFKLGQVPGRRRYALLAALFLLFQAYAELTYATFLVLFTALWALWQVGLAWRRREWPGLARLAGGLALLGLIFGLGLVPMLANILPDMLVEGDIYVEGGGFADVFSADLVGFWVPTRLHPLLGSLVRSFDFHYGVGQHIYLGYTLLALAILGAVAGRRRPAVWFWSLAAILFWLLTLGPTLLINGQDSGLPLPFALVARLPFFKGNRYPSRYSVLLVLSLAVLVGYGSARIMRWWAARRSGAARTVLLLLAGLFLFEHLSAPLPLSDMRVPEVYRAIAADMPGDFTLLDLPLAWRNGSRVTGTQHPTIMYQQYYQAVHGKRLLAGNTSRNPPLKFQYFTEAPLLNSLIALETGHQVAPAVAERDRALAGDVLRFFDIGAIVVHPAQAGPDMIPYIEATLPVSRFYESEAEVGYRVELPPLPDEWRITPGDDLARLSYAEGWGVPAGGVIWAQRRAARLLVPLNGQGQRLAFRAYVPRGGQRLEVEINGRTVGWIGMAAGWMEYEIDLPAAGAGAAVRPGLNEIWLRFERLYPAREVALAARDIGQTGAHSPVNLVVQSAGQEVGNLGHIYVDGRDVSPGGRGYNVAVLDPRSGAVQQVATFDTHLDERASQALAAFLHDVPAGRIVAVAAADEASRLLGPEAVEALLGVGAAVDLRDRFRWGHAIIGVQGASPGTALEAADWMRPVTLVVGEGATEPNLAAAFATVTFTAVPDRP